MTTLDERHGEPEAEAQAEATARNTAAVPLDAPGAALPRLTGSKAANLARAARAGLPVLPGFVIPHGGGGDSVALRRAWDDLSDGGTLPLVVRSSSPQEDTEGSSLAGRFASVLDVRGWPAFRAAVRAVLDSARLPDGSTAPMAVLVQPMLGARAGGVMFGADPVAGRSDRMLVSAVHGGPDSLVGGERTGTGYRLSARGRLLRTEQAEQPEHTEEGPPLTRSELARLVRLARRARKVFGGPQDIEFGFDTDGRLWLFQSRPITAMAARPARGARLLGPGPVAETLPAQMTPLEEDLWVMPMAHGLAAALDIGGTAPRRLLRTVPVVRTVGGRAAADLRLLGAVRPRHPWLALLNPAPGARRLAAAWRVGRLGTALPGLATDLVADVDRRLAEIPAPAGTPSPALVAELRWTRRVLVSLHAQEALAGALLPEPPTSRTAAGAALTALAAARARGVPDAQVIAAEPVVLALTAPSLRGRPRTPDAHVPGQGDSGTGGGGHHRASGQDPRHADHPFTHPLTHPPAPSPVPGLPPREALRLRIRWVQELQVRLAREAARRTGLDVERLALLRWTEVAAALEGRPLPADVHTRVPPTASPALPDAFRLAEGEVVVAEHHDDHSDDSQGDQGDGNGNRGLGASRGRAVGTAWDGTGPRPPDAVLVVRTLDPALAPLLPDLTGLVAQTGSPLSHLAVLAREFGLPAVVGAAHAVRRFPPGSRLSLDGTTGDVRAGEAP
ncbi:PEP/pyruvate-binding domain-containing protein [Streptomyces sp. Amel2xC10]|uniref:PEP/pyruvate-binding domain-containing protein n=1 Tax=Streptomyces sp. Amel2xC10 TaxID=1305826 RepID=UPI000A08DC88|nr:PEP/pyruvate-binding domain-containing protein [Streptomyces sp. Amel2xC10]SMF28878.1 pyruvate, water dikinase [Streptomyces sp. Amel2xC10]